MMMDELCRENADDRHVVGVRKLTGRRPRVTLGQQALDRLWLETTGVANRLWPGYFANPFPTFGRGKRQGVRRPIGLLGPLQNFLRHEVPRRALEHMLFVEHAELV